MSLFAAITTVIAAPPRFSKFPTDSIDKAKAEEKARAEAAAKAKADAASKSNDATNAQDSVSASEPEQVLPPSVTSTTSTSTPAQSASTTSAPPPEAKKRESWFSRLFGKNKKSKQVKTHKHPDELVNTENRHMNPSESLGIADLHRYSPGLTEFWKVDASKSLCAMRQKINHYGHVEFRQGVGQPLEFALFVAHPPAGIGKAHVRTEPPEWQHYSKARDLGVIEVEPGERAVTASQEWSRRLFLEMSEGMRPVMRYWDAADGADDMEVMLSALNFQESLDLFHRCVGQLLKYDYRSVKRTIVHFHEDSSKLRVKAKRQLDEVLEILNADEGVKQIDLELYTHSKGLVRYNFRLATRRARGVRDYLIKRGIDEDKLLIKIHTKRSKDLKKLGYNPTDVHIVLQRKVAK
ncbi:hypothetical protein MNBD_GAMMA21-1554 [hydrothermal vent metagenome]|uniref:OmpA-like domain-containing protein n=1 Tax=hydrothermal vent metagenome TaxID=652676 RepID=A0A3B1A6V4_9ZZZZ